MDTKQIHEPIPVQWKAQYHTLLVVIDQTPYLSISGLSRHCCRWEGHLKDCLLYQRRLQLGMPPRLWGKWVKMRSLTKDEFVSLLTYLTALRNQVADLITLADTAGVKTARFQYAMARLYDDKTLIVHLILNLPAPMNKEAREGFFKTKVEKKIKTGPITEPTILARLKPCLIELWMCLEELPELPLE